MHSPHALFIYLLATSVTLTAISLLLSNSIDELESMLIIFIPSLVAAFLILVCTRQYWSGLRRIES